VLDLDWNPFNENLVASVSEDCTGKIWGIPDGGLKENLHEPLQTLNGHKRKVGTVSFSPVANNIVATTSTDFSVKVWDIEKGTAHLSVDGQHADIIQAAQWNTNGSLLATSSKDKKLRVIDPRHNSVAAEGVAHEGIKGSRVTWLGASRLFSAGFTKTSERETCVWDSRDLSKPLLRQNLDSASGILMPFYDADNGLLYLAGKGDGNIRYFETVDEAPYLHFISEFKSNTPLRGCCFLPKRALNVADCEIARALKAGVKTVDPISFQVPRKSDIFQEDLFPDTASGEPSLSAAEWLGGRDAEPKKTSMAPGFVAKAKPAAEFNPTKVEEKQLSEKELREEHEKLSKRVSYLEAELAKRDARIKELTGN
jgi:coronin-1B/1C/6